MKRLGKTRTLRASNEVRDVPWEAATPLVAAKFEPTGPEGDCGPPESDDRSQKWWAGPLRLETD